MEEEIVKEELKPLSYIIRNGWRGIVYRFFIVRHENTYITLRFDKKKVMYCSRCWDKDKDLIQMNKQHAGRISCPNCKQICCYDRNLYNEAMTIRKPIVDNITNRRR